MDPRWIDVPLMMAHGLGVQLPKPADLQVQSTDLVDEMSIDRLAVLWFVGGQSFWLFLPNIYRPRQGPLMGPRWICIRSLNPKTHLSSSLGPPPSISTPNNLRNMPRNTKTHPST